MAYGLKYKAYHWTVDGLQKEIRFYKDGYAGAVTTWLTEKTGIRHIIGAEDMLFPSNRIITSQREFTFIFTQLYDLTEFVYYRKTFKVEIVAVISGLVEWSGWVEPWDASHDYARPPHIAKLTAGCGLSQLPKKRYVNNEIETDKTELLILQECLALMGSALPLRVSIHLKEVNYISDARYGLLSAKIDTNRYYESSGDRLYCDVIVNDILKKFNAQLFQYNNRWLMISTPDQALGTHTSYVEYPGIGEAPNTVESWDTDYITNRSIDEDENALTLDGGTIRILPPANKYHIHGDYNPRKGFFRNGDLRLWDAGGLLYWNFLMPSGNPGWQKVTTGNAEYPFALRVNGQGPVIVKEYKKHWYSKKTVKAFEPTIYIESSIGVFPPRNNIQLSFEYYTGVNVFLVGVRVSSSINPTKVKWFNADGTSSTEWSGITIAEANEGNGKTKKGKFEISIDLRYLNTISRDSSAPWEPYNQVHVRFYQSYPGPGELSPYYKIYNLLGSSEQQNGLTFLDGIYDTELQYQAETDEEGETIDLITGDYAQGWTGTTTGSFTGDPTMYWTRRGNNEEITIYRAMMLDMLAMTRFPVRVLEGDVKILPGTPPLHYLNILKLTDLDNARFKIVRFEYEEYRRIAKVTAIEIKYNAVPAEALVQSTYVRGGKVYFENGESDGLLPGESDDSGAIIGDDQVPLTDQQIEADIDERLPNTIFTEIDPLVFIAGSESTEVVDLADFYTEEYSDPDIERGPDAPVFSLSLVWKPDWISEITFDELEITVTAIAPKSGSFYLTVLLSDATSGKSLEVRVPITVTPSTDFAESWPPIFTDLPDLYFTVGIESMDHVLLTDYMDPDHAAAIGYTFRFLDIPGWVSAKSVVFMNVSITGTATVAETRTTLIEIKDIIGRTYSFPIRLISIAGPIVTAELLDTTSGVVVLGDIPGNYEVTTRFDVRFTITGKHDEYDASLSGGGLLGTAISDGVSVSITEVDTGTYRFYGSSGTPAFVGKYSLTVTPKLHDNATTPQVIDFVLYDDDYLALIVNAFLSDGLLVSYILPDGTSVYDNDGVEIWGVNSEVDGPEHDKVTQELYSEDGTLLTTTVHTLAVDETYGVYQLDSSPVARGPGKYKLVTELEKDGLPVMISSVRFEIKGLDEDGCCEGYAVNFGNGVDTNYILSHGLNTKDLHVSFKRNTDERAIELAWEVVDLNSIEVGCSARSIPMLNKYRALIEKN